MSWTHRGPESELLDLSHNLDHLLGHFSLGMKKKTVLLAIMLLRPKFLIMDEPTSGLDAPSVIVFKGFIQALAENGCTMILSSHEVDFIGNVADQVLILHDRKIAFSDSSIKESQVDLNSVYRKIIVVDINHRITEILHGK